MKLFKLFKFHSKLDLSSNASQTIDVALKMRRLCVLDDVGGVLAFLRTLGAKPDTEIANGQIPVLFAIAADAPKVFKKLIAMDGRGRRRGLGARLHGGYTPAHLCCNIPRGLLASAGAFAPKCLAASIEMDPLLAMRANEERGSLLATASLTPDPSPFKLLVESLAEAVANGSAPSTDVVDLCRKAAVALVRHTRGGGPQERLAKLGSLSAAGLDWRSITDPETGSSMLGATLPGGGYGGHGQPALGSALLAQGADPMGPALTAGGSILPCIDVILGDQLIWAQAPGLSLAAHLSLADPAFAERFGDPRQADLLRDMCSYLSGASPGSANQVLFRLAKIEAAAIAECVPAARVFKAPKSL